MTDGKGRRRFFCNHNFTLKSFIFFFQIVKFAFDEIKFFPKPFVIIYYLCLLSYLLSCSFIAKSISSSLVIFSDCFLVRMLLPAIFILLTISDSALVEKASKLYESMVEIISQCGPPSCTLPRTIFLSHSVW